MESILLSYEEYKILNKYKSHLESTFDILITIPNSKNTEFSETDIIFAFLKGNNIQEVKNFMNRKLKGENEKSQEGSFPVITLSDSEHEAEVFSPPKKATKKRKKNKRKLLKNLEAEKDKCEVSSTTNDDVRKKFKGDVSNMESNKETPDFNSNLSKPDTNEKVEKESLNTGTDKVQSDFKFASSAAEFLSLDCISKQAHNSSVMLDDSIVILDDNNANAGKNSKTDSENDDIIILDEISSSSVPRPACDNCSRLRPIVIDGSNVARSHGIVSKTFSSRGIEISIEYFLQRGHTSVTAFVPNFRRHAKKQPFPTSNPEILESLAEKQLVVFTPNKSYDDRFILQLASLNQGVILSNDNYRDLKDESTTFKETIENRLLTYCFVGDILMIPSDPLGRAGPNIKEFLALPPSVT